MTQQANGRVLLIEDHKDIAEMVYAYLERRNYDMDYAGDGVTGLHLAVSNDYDAIVLDLMLPGMDGLVVCEKLRTDARKNTPVLMLTARDTLEDKLAGLDIGADDYLVKPFEVRELEARVRALIRRQQGATNTELLQVGDLKFDTGTLEVTRQGKDLHLSPTCMKILRILMTASPKVVSRNELERQIWGDILPDSDTLRSHLYKLRQTIDKPFEGQMLQTMQGSGYRVIAADEP
jgi:DNA-binding response OmpR family regulator